MLAQSGIPVLYAGDEVGQLNDERYRDDPEKAGDSRYIHRGSFQWETACQRQDMNTVTGQLFHGLRRLEQIRMAHAVFDADADFWTEDTGNNAVLALSRYKEGENLYSLYNFSGESQIVLPPQGCWHELYSGKDITVSGALTVEGYGFLWLAAQV